MIDKELEKAMKFAGVGLEEYTVDEFQDNFDELFARVEAGETFIICHPDGYKVYITPLSDD